MSEYPHEEVVLNGKIGEVVHTTQLDGRIFERYRRPPGTRLVIVTALIFASKATRGLLVRFIAQ